MQHILGKVFNQFVLYLPCLSGRRKDQNFLPICFIPAIFIRDDEESVSLA